MKLLVGWFVERRPVNSTEAWRRLPDAFAIPDGAHQVVEMLRQMFPQYEYRAAQVLRSTTSEPTTIDMFE